MKRIRALEEIITEQENKRRKRNNYVNSYKPRAEEKEDEQREAEIIEEIKALKEELRIVQMRLEDDAEEHKRFSKNVPEPEFARTFLELLKRDGDCFFAPGNNVVGELKYILETEMSTSMEYMKDDGFTKERGRDLIQFIKDNVTLSDGVAFATVIGDRFVISDDEDSEDEPSLLPSIRLPDISFEYEYDSTTVPTLESGDAKCFDSAEWVEIFAEALGDVEPEDYDDDDEGIMSCKRVTSKAVIVHIKRE
jgi:hypothetical protein